MRHAVHFLFGFVIFMFAVVVLAWEVVGFLLDWIDRFLCFAGGIILYLGPVVFPVVY